MRRSSLVLSSLFLLPVLSYAQQAPARFTNVSLIEVPVAESARFEDGVRAIVEAAAKAKLKARWGWEMWQNDNTYAVISGMQSIGEMDDPMLWIRQFANTPGEAALTQAFRKLNGMQLKETIEVMAPAAEWTYVPASGPPPQPAYAQVYEYWLVAGSDEEYDRIVREAIAIIKSINYPFMIIGNRTPVGQRRVQFVWLHSDPARFVAEEARLMRNPQWQALVGRVTPLIADMNSTTWRARSELGYRGMP
jgi:hypothetical protein